MNHIPTYALRLLGAALLLSSLHSPAHAQRATTIPVGLRARTSLQDAVTDLVARVPLQDAGSASRGRAGRERAPSEEHLVVGVEVDAGLPHLVGGNVIVSPWDWLQVAIGGFYNGGAGGGRLGTRFLIPGLQSIFNLGLGLEGGLGYGGIDLITRAILDTTDLANVSIRDVTTAYGAGTLHMELGAERFRFVLDLGIAYVHNWLGEIFVPGAEGAEGTTIRNAEEWHVIPAGRGGFQLFFDNP